MHGYEIKLIIKAVQQQSVIKIKLYRSMVYDLIQQIYFISRYMAGGKGSLGGRKNISLRKEVGKNKVSRQLFSKKFNRKTSRLFFFLR